MAYLFSTLTTNWKRMTIHSTPSSVNDQRQSQLLTSILFAVIGIGTILQFIAYLLAPPEMRLDIFTAGLLTVGLMLIPYFLSRAGFYKWAAVLTIVLFDLAIFIVISRGSLVLSYLLLPVLISSLLLANRYTFFVYLFNLGAIYICYRNTDLITTIEAQSAAMFLSFMTFVLLAAAYRRNQAEQHIREVLEIRVAERTSDLLAANHSLNKQIAEREQAEAAEKQARQTKEILQNATLSLTQSLELDDVLDTLLAFLNQLVPYDSGNVMLRRGGQEIQIVAVRGYERWVDLQQVRFHSFTLYHYPNIEKLITSGYSVLIPDVEANPEWIIPENGSGSHVNSWMGVPLIAAGEVIGLYSLDKVEKGYFTEEHLQLAETLAAQAAVAIQNAALFAQVRDGREQLRQLTQQMVNVEEEGRRRISRELHDEAGQALTALKFSLAMIYDKLPDGCGCGSAQSYEPDKLREHVHSAITLCETTMDQVRHLAHVLRPAAIDDLGLQPALEGFCRDYAYHTPLEISFSGVNPPILPDAVNITLYRFLQEALANTAKHAQAESVLVHLWFDESNVYLSVTDDGRGFILQPKSSDTPIFDGIGIAGMQERLHLVGGDLTIQSQSGRGSTFTARVPW